jgi:hypothetical protein
MERRNAVAARRGEAEVEPGLGILGNRALGRIDPETGRLLPYPSDVSSALRQVNPSGFSAAS